jgi:hypothetical protein
MSGSIKFRSSHDGESGATVVIVALVLVALMGMLVLVVDVGGLLWKRRELVNASDAAALSAAHTCALKLSVDGKNAQQAADLTAATNITGTGLTGTVTDSGGCHTGASGWVKVQYSQPQHLFFAPVLGFSNTNGVTTKATAIWGPAGAANPVPVVIYQNSFNNCRLQDPSPEPTCYVWEDNSSTSGSQNGFGFLDLNIDPNQPRDYGWDSQSGAKCNNPGSDIKGWIQNYPDAGVGDLPLNYPQATYVCLASGGKSSAFGNDPQQNGPLYDLIGEVLLFPLNRCDPNSPATFGQLANGSPTSCGNTPDQYDIVGFVAMRILHIYTPNDAAGSNGSCSPNNAPVTMVNGTTIMLDAFGTTNGCFTTSPSSYSNVSVTKDRNNQPGPQPVGCLGVAGPTCDFTVSQTGQLTWNASGPAAENQPYDISFQWVLNGPCGAAPQGNSGHCMVVQVVEVQVGGTNPGQGDPNSNLRAVKLCDQAITGSCGSVIVPNP